MDSFLSGKGRSDWEALEGLHQGVGSLEGSLGLLCQDFHPWTIMNQSSLVEVATGGMVVAVRVVFYGGSGGNYFLRSSLDFRSSSAWTCSSKETCL